MEKEAPKPSELQFLRKEVLGLKDMLSELSTKVEALEVRPLSYTVPEYNMEASLTENMGEFNTDPSKLVDI